MSWPLLDATPRVSIRLHNPALGVDYPRTGDMNAIVDTGFQGFLLVPWSIFQEMGFTELSPIHRDLLAADGERISVRGAYGSIEFPSLGKESDGLVESSAVMDEILLGVEALEGLVFELDACLRESRLRPC